MYEEQFIKNSLVVMTKSDNYDYQVLFYTSSIMNDLEFIKNKMDEIRLKESLTIEGKTGSWYMILPAVIGGGALYMRVVHDANLLDHENDTYRYEGGVLKGEDINHSLTILENALEQLRLSTNNYGLNESKKI